MGGCKRHDGGETGREVKGERMRMEGTGARVRVCLYVREREYGEGGSPP
jgi:hypothetical protein